MIFRGGSKQNATYLMFLIRLASNETKANVEKHTLNSKVPLVQVVSAVSGSAGRRRV